MKNSLWLLIVIVAGVLTYLAGYSISSKTGVEPGYFEMPEAGGYGAGVGGEKVEGISDEYQEYYKELAK